jgi:hypothetical protein
MSICTPTGNFTCKHASLLSDMHISIEFLLASAHVSTMAIGRYVCQNMHLLAGRHVGDISRFAFKQTSLLFDNVSKCA